LSLDVINKDNRALKFISKQCFNRRVLQPYSKSKLELESNLSEILPVICKFISGLVVMSVRFAVGRLWLP